MENLPPISNQFTMQGRCTLAYSNKETMMSLADTKALEHQAN